jgi:hypothetical protein
MRIGSVRTILVHPAKQRHPAAEPAILENAMIRRRVLPLLLIVACMSQSALAQINPFRGSSATPLSEGDVAALTNATNRLLDRPQLVVGGIETWSNPQSGASGTVTAGSAVRRRGLACRVVSYQSTVPGPRAERSATLTWCKTEDGWKIG